MKKKLVAMTFGWNAPPIPGTRAVPILKPGEIGLVKYYEKGPSVITKKPKFALKDLETSKEKMADAMKNLNITSSPHTKYFDEDGKRVNMKKVADAMKKKLHIVVETKEEIAKQLGWGTSKRHYKKGHVPKKLPFKTWDKTHLIGVDPAYSKGDETAYFLPIDGVMVRHALIQKKHLDEAAWGLEFAERILRQGPHGHAIPNILARMREALKNISVK